MNARLINPLLRVVLDANVLAYAALGKLLIRLTRDQRLVDLVHGYSAQLDRFTATLLADLP